MLNQLAYTPRPVFLAHQSYSPALAELNARFYEGETAPEYVLMRPQTIDSRFLPADDARVLPILLQNYRPVLEENGWWLLQRDGPMERTVFGAVRKPRTTFGSPIKVPTPPDALVAAAIQIEPTVLGRLRAFIYKPPEITLRVDDGIGGPRRFRLLRPAAAGGFLVTPLLRDAEDYRFFAERGATPLARQIGVEIDPAALPFYKKNFRVIFSTAPLRRPPD